MIVFVRYLVLVHARTSCSSDISMDMFVSDTDGGGFCSDDEPDEPTKVSFSLLQHCTSPFVLWRSIGLVPVLWDWQLFQSLHGSQWGL